LQNRYNGTKLQPVLTRISANRNKLAGCGSNHYLKDSHLHFVEILQYETEMDALRFFLTSIQFHEVILENAFMTRETLTNSDMHFANPSS
jgi:hypothetical protein